MRELFEEQLLLLNQELTEMGALCEEIISLASQALVSYDKALGEKVSKVGAKIDEEERTIETICMRLLLRQQPVARDLPCCLRRAENDHGHGAYWRSGGGHCGDHPLHDRSSP